MSQLPPSPAPINYGMPISLSDAKKVMLSAEAEAVRNSWAMVIAIVDSTGHLVLLQRLDQAQYGSIKIAQLKAETALDFRRPTKVFEDSIAAGGQGVRIVSMPNVLALEGGLPIIADGKVIGAIGVSGMQSGQDAQVALAGMAALG
jgi:glc operon protein GlcG